MKKLFLFILMSALFLTSTALAQDDISLYINGSKINCDVAPQLVNDRTLCPTRAIFDAFGASVEWDGANKQVTVKKDRLRKLKSGIARLCADDNFGQMYGANTLYKRNSRL